MKAKKIKELASDIMTTARVAITGEGETIGYAKINRQDLVEVLAMVSDDTEVDARVEDEEAENQLTKIYFREGILK